MVHKKIWNSRLFSDPRNVKHIDVMLNAPRPSGYVAFQDKYEALDEIPCEELPTGICFKSWNTPQKKKDNLPDMFLITLGLVIVTKRMHDLLQQFDLGRARFHEVPFYEYDRTTRFRGRWFLMYQWEDHPTLVSEKSTGLDRIWPDKDVWQTWDGSEYEVVVDPSAAENLDLWQDFHLSNSLFFSDRLKKAIKASGMNTRWLGFRSCTLASN